MNFDSLLITGGIHKNDFLNVELKNYKNIFKKYDVKINYYQEKLRW